ncbi:MAG: hypothetical protein HN855_11775 [Anaerolineae bacterium]|jgi:hypothetical protein|nr:hypothetical protein [Anaerolineae bacterium]MBT7071332.1 hypothetical protein [Anaerolineae bacterium]MBT7325832.1 hypothetical protein [Anaerolineae bacterium]
MKAQHFLTGLKRLANSIKRTKSIDDYAEMLQKSIQSWQNIEKQNQRPLWDDPIMDLITRFDCSQVRIGNFYLLPAPSKPYIGDVYQFLSGPRDYYVGRNSHDVYQFYYKEAWPTSMGVESESFLTGLFYYAEYLTHIKKGITPEARAALDTQYPAMIKNAPFHPLRRKVTVTP